MRHTQNPRHSIIIPAYNERKRLPEYLPIWITAMRLRGESFEILVVDDGSTDGTVEWLREVKRTTPELRILINRKNSGKGFTVKRGMLAARGDMRLMADADGATPVAEYDNLLAHFDPERHPIAIGIRIPLRGITTVDRDLIRHYIGRISATVISIVSGLEYYDTQCGFKMFSASATRKIFPLVRCTKFAFDVEVLLLAEKFNLPVAEVPVSWREVPGSKVSLWKHIPKGVVDIIKIRARHGRGKFRAF